MNLRSLATLNVQPALSRNTGAAGRERALPLSGRNKHELAEKTEAQAPARRRAPLPAVRWLPRVREERIRRPRSRGSRRSPQQAAPPKRQRVDSGPRRLRVREASSPNQ